jgi:hypothetical protein
MAVQRNRTPYGIGSDVRVSNCDLEERRSRSVAGRSGDGRIYKGILWLVAALVQRTGVPFEQCPNVSTVTFLTTSL